jgi:DNA-binding beta-propeller fold protein YncE
MGENSKKAIRLLIIFVVGSTAFYAALCGLNRAISGSAGREAVSLEPPQKTEKAEDQKAAELRSKSFNLKFDTWPKNAGYTVILSDGSEKKGKSPFEEKASGGNLAIILSYEGYNTLKTDMSLDKDVERIFYLDKKGQLVRHLLNIESVPSPKGAVFSPDGAEIWTTMLLNKKRGVSVFDAATGKNLADIDLSGGGGVEALFSRDGSKVYASQMETAKVYEIDAKTKKVERVFDTKSAWTKVIELSPDGKTLYASNWSGNDVSEISLETGKLVRRLPTVKTPRGLYPTPDGKYLYVAGFGLGQVEKIDLGTGVGKVIFTSGGAMRHFAADQERGLLYLSDMGANKIWQITLADDTVKKFADTDFDPNTIVLSPDKKILFVSCRGKNAANGNYYIPGPEWGSVLLFDTGSKGLLDAIVGGNQPTALDVSRDGRLMVFSDFLDSRLEIFGIPAYETLKNGNGGRSEQYKAELSKK